MRLKPLISPRLADAQAEEARRVTVDAINAIHGLPAAQLRVIADVKLADGVETPVPHKLGRAAAFVTTSAPRGATSTGRIEEVRGGTDRNRAVTLKATGWGATITVDVIAL